jgi:hypothetical protein
MKEEVEFQRGSNQTKAARKLLQQENGCALAQGIERIFPLY